MKEKIKISNGMKWLLVLVGMMVMISVAGSLRCFAAPAEHDEDNLYYFKYIQYKVEGYKKEITSFEFKTKYKIALVKGNTKSFVFTDDNYLTVSQQWYDLCIYNPDNTGMETISANYEMEYYTNVEDTKPSNTSKGEGVRIAFCNLHDVMYNNGSRYGFYDIHDTNIPIFTSYTAAEKYFLTGYIEPKEIYNENFTLLGFQCDNGVNASWTGYKSDIWVDGTICEVHVEPRYFIILEQGEEEQNFKVPDAEIIKYSDYKYYKNYDDFYINNPYKGRCELILYFYPTYLDKENNILYKGKSIAVTINKSGDIDDVHVPEVALTATYDNEFYLKNFIAKNEFHNWSDCYIHTYWTGSSIESTIDYVYSDIKVQLYARKGSIPEPTYGWIDYDMNDIISIRDNGISFNLTKLDDYCRTKGYRFYDSTHQWGDERIRITPYYKTNENYCYGKSIEIHLTTLAGIKAVLQSNGDVFDLDNPPSFDDLQEDYFDDNSIIDDIYNDLLNEESGEFDITKVTSNFFTIMWDLLRACGQFPKLVSDVLSFLPQIFVNMLLGALSIAFVLRLLGR